MTWTESHSDRVACLRCREMKPRADLDRLLWCEGCREAVHGRASARSWLVGLMVSVVLSLWIWFYVQPSNLVIGGWIGTVLAAFYVSARVAREVFYASARMAKPDDAGAVSPGQDPH